MILVQQLLQDPRTHYDNIVSFVSSKQRPRDNSEISKTLRLVKRSAYLNTEPEAIGPMETAHMQDTRVVCLSAAIGEMYCPPDYNPAMIPMYNKGTAEFETTSASGTMEYYIMDSRKVEHQTHLIIQEMYNLAIVPEPSTEMEYIMMNKTPTDLDVEGLFYE